jgi:hypothetical protein
MTMDLGGAQGHGSEWRDTNIMTIITYVDDTGPKQAVVVGRHTGIEPYRVDGVGADVHHTGEVLVRERLLVAHDQFAKPGAERLHPDGLVACCQGPAHSIHALAQLPAPVSGITGGVSQG